MAVRSSSARILGPAPRAFLDPATRTPVVGSFAGPLPRIDLRPILLASSPFYGLLRRKKWLWLSAATDEVWLSLAIVRMGYAATAFAFVYEHRSRTMVVDETVLAPPFAADVADDPHASGVLARFARGRSRLSIARRGEALDVHVEMPSVVLDAVLAPTNTPPISAIALLEAASGRAPPSLSGTEKRAFMPIHGTLVVRNVRRSLDGAVAGYDYTHGLLPRRTRWRWAFAMGRTREGERIGWNLVEGFVGDAECAVFRDGAVLPVNAPRFAFDRERPESAWRLVGPGLDLSFDVGAVHAQRTNLGVVRSRFVQPVGIFRGVVTVDGSVLTVDGVPGVVEDQDVVW